MCVFQHLACDTDIVCISLWFISLTLLLETLLDRNKFKSSLSCLTQFAKRILDKYQLTLTVFAIIATRFAVLTKK